MYIGASVTRAERERDSDVGPDLGCCSHHLSSHRGCCAVNLFLTSNEVQSSI